MSDRGSWFQAPDLERLWVWDILWALTAGRAPADQFGAVAQLGERLHGMQEVVGSIPIGSTFQVTVQENGRLRRQLVAS